MVAKEFGEVNVGQHDGTIDIMAMTLMEPMGAAAEGWQTVVALDASASMPAPTVGIWGRPARLVIRRQTCSKNTRNMAGSGSSSTKGGAIPSCRMLHPAVRKRDRCSDALAAC